MDVDADTAEAMEGVVGRLRSVHAWLRSRLDAHVKEAGLMKVIVPLGWATYPAGYFIVTISRVAPADVLNVIYKIADLTS